MVWEKVLGKVWGKVREMVWEKVQGMVQGMVWIGGSEGGPPFLNFMQFFGKFGKIVCWCPSPGGLIPLLRRILDPPLVWGMDWGMVWEKVQAKVWGKVPANAL